MMGNESPNSLEEDICNIIKKECPKLTDLFKKQYDGQLLFCIKSGLERNSTKDFLVAHMNGEKMKYALASEIISEILMLTVSNYMISDEDFLEFRKEGKNLLKVAIWGKGYAPKALYP